MPAELWFRVDASPEIGAGHFMRCFALAEHAALRGVRSTFAGTLQEPLVARLHAIGAGHVPAGTAVPRGATVVLDGYRFDAACQTELREGRRLLVVDDTGYLPAYDCDWLLNHNLFAGEVAYPATAAERLFGPGFFPLRREFAGAAAERRIAPVARRVLLTLGGGDPHGASGRLLEALLDHDVTVRAVAGPLADAAQLAAIASAHRYRVTLIRDARDLAADMAWADLAVTGAGTTSLECAATGLPMLLVTLAANQQRGAAAMADRGAAVNLGTDWDGDRLAAILTDVLRDAARRERMSDCGRRLVDGEGAGRVLDRLGIAG